MTCQPETVALVALLRGCRRSLREQANEALASGNVMAQLEAEHGLFADDALARACAEIALWERRGIRVVSPADCKYPDRMRTVAERPPLLFVAGALEPADERAVAVVGSRQATAAGIRAAQAIAALLVERGFTVISGLAAGIDTAAHAAALHGGGRTVAVIGTGLDRCYPAQNAVLQRQIAARCAVVSQFWPEAAPSRSSFPMRNAVTSGLGLGTVVVEASQTSGARIQARYALAQGRPVMLLERLLEQTWARELAARPGVHVVASPAEIVSGFERLWPPWPSDASAAAAGDLAARTSPAGVPQQRASKARVSSQTVPADAAAA
ncbi:MAG: DNA-processing protein DprA [Solirubrobacteraceae bacterium]